MRKSLRFVSTRCAICQSEANADQLYSANFDESAFNPAVFSARRLPDRIHYRLVRCRSCGLVRSDPVVDPEVIHQLYTRSSFDYDTEVGGLRVTYGRYLARLERCGARPGALLEIGGGNGFFLEEALRQGYQTVKGIEPSQAAIDRADPAIKPHLVCDIARPGLFPADSFDVICMFHVFDHLPDPSAVLDECLRLLRPGGLLLCICHDVDAPSSRVFRERSPIIDIEHTYLYGPTTGARIFRDHSFVVQSVGPVWNVYALRYIAQLMPLPTRLKRSLLAALQAGRLGAIQLALPLGNMYLVARKPADRASAEPST